jgi:hypothetical protein
MSSDESGGQCGEGRRRSDDQFTAARLRLRARAAFALYLFAGLAVGGALIIDSCAA